MFLLRFLRMRSFLFVSLALLCAVAWGFMGEFYRNRGLQEDIEALQAKADEIEARNLELADLREKFAGSGELEREARLKLNLQKPGEQVVIIQDDPDDLVMENARDEEGLLDGDRKANNAEKWWDFFFRRVNNERR